MADGLIRHFLIMAQYNTLANVRLYEHCARLSDAERKRIRPAFFKSIHGTLNHIMVGDRIWLTRFEGGDAPSTHLDAILYEDFAELRAARVREDDRIARFAAGLTRDFLDGSFSYINNAGKSCTDPASVLVAHFFNHQTHHRGQIHDMPTQTDVAPPVLDLHRILIP